MPTSENFRVTNVLRFAVCLAILFVAACSQSSGSSTPPPAATAPETATIAQNTSSTAATPTAASAYRLGAGDQLRITVFGHEDLSGEFDVDGSGDISMPLIDNVRAEGKTPNELEAAIVSELSPDYLKDPRVSVDVLSYRPFYIFGEVNEPGSYAYVNGMTVLNAVAMAGGFTYRARTGEVQIIRATDQSRTPQEAQRDTFVLPGDVIEVPERFF